MTGDLAQLPKRDRNWLSQFHDIETFSTVQNRAPTEKSVNVDEAALATWARRQRTNVHRLCHYQIDLLNVLPHYRWDPRDEHKIFRQQEHDEFLTREGRDPQRRSRDPGERSLARWAGRN